MELARTPEDEAIERREKLEAINGLRNRVEEKISQAYGNRFRISRHIGITNVFRKGGSEVCSVDFSNGEVILYDKTFEKEANDVYMALAVYLDSDVVGRYGKVQLRREYL